MKIKKVKVETPSGTKYLSFRPAPPEDENKGGMICDTVCPYGEKMCFHLRDPRNPEDEEGSFTDFCGDLGDEEDTVNPDCINYYPCAGTIEENLSDQPDVFELLIKKNSYIKITDLIDNVCQDSCPFYTEDHSKCSSKNSLCLLQGALKKANYNSETENGGE